MSAEDYRDKRLDALCRATVHAIRTGRLRMISADHFENPGRYWKPIADKKRKRKKGRRDQ